MKFLLVLVLPVLIYAFSSALLQDLNWYLQLSLVGIATLVAIAGPTPTSHAGSAPSVRVIEPYSPTCSTCWSSASMRA